MQFIDSIQPEFEDLLTGARAELSPEAYSIFYAAADGFGQEEAEDQRLYELEDAHGYFRPIPSKVMKELASLQILFTCEDSEDFEIINIFDHLREISDPLPNDPLMGLSIHWAPEATPCFENRTGKICCYAFTESFATLLMDSFDDFDCDPEDCQLCPYAQGCSSQSSHNH